MKREVGGIRYELSCCWDKIWNLGNIWGGDVGVEVFFEFWCV